MLRKAGIMRVTIKVENGSYSYVIHHADGARSTHLTEGDFDLREFIKVVGAGSLDRIVVSHFAPEYVDNPAVRPRYRCVTEYAGDGMLIGDLTAQTIADDEQADEALGYTRVEASGPTDLPEGFYFVTDLNG